MGRKTFSGLFRRGSIWHIDKRFKSRRICESTGTSQIKEAEIYLAHRLEEIRQAEVYGVRPKRIFREAATRYLEEATKATIREDARQLRLLDPYIGLLPLQAVHMGTLLRFIKNRKARGLRNRTVNCGLQVVRHILNLAAGEWIDEYGMTWLPHAPKIKLIPEIDRQEPYPLSWEEQDRLFNELPDYLKRMALFKVNTGCRDQEVCGLRWQWEVEVPELNTSVFIIPGQRVKNRQDRLVVLNQIAWTIAQQMRGEHPEYVFSFEGHRIRQMYGRAWRAARDRAGLPQVRVHDLKHTFGRRLGAAGVSFEDRQDLLGHKSGRITTHYSQVELTSLISAANAVCGDTSRKTPALTILRKRLTLVSNG